MFHNSYLKQEKIWEEESDVPVPRRVWPRPGGILLSLALIGLIGLLLEGVAYFVNTAIIQNGKWNAENLVPVLLILLGGVFWWVGSKEKRSVRNWARVIGKIEIITPGFRRSQTYGVGYEYNRNFFRADISEEAGGLTHSEVGDSVVLLVDPQDPNSVLAYGGSSWRILK